MSTTIEQEIVQMVFDAKQFQKGVQESLVQIEEFKKAFNFDAAQKSMANLEKASKIDFSGMEKAISGISGKISLLGVAAATVVQNITNSVVDGVKKLFNSLVLTPVLTGLEEYETQLNAIQTILANTRKDGTTLKDVTIALDELNTYADKTIYNFTQMTDSIGKFTAAGISLDTSVEAIKGIANLAAVSGSNAQQASNAMYQLSQAISTGALKLQDWNSVVNAGLGGQVFQDSLIETARVHGIKVDEMIEKNGSFRQSLQEGWISSEILLETLAKFTGDLTEEQLTALGYTEEQIAGIIELGETANDAATKIKTLTQFKDTLLEALQSGWSQTWRIVLGDFEEAKELWGSLNDVFGDMIGRSSDARNQMLSFWEAAGGRDQAIQALFNVIEAGVNIFSAFREAISDIWRPFKAADLIIITRAILDFTEKLKMASENTGDFQRIVRGIAAAIDIVRLVILAVLKPIGDLLQRLSPAAASFLETSLSVSDAIVAFRAFAIETGYFDTVVANVIAKAGELIDRVKELVRRFLELEVVQSVIKYFQSIERSDVVNFFNNLLNVLKLLAAPFVFIAISLKRVYDEVVKLDVVQRLAEWFKSISWQDIKNGLTGVADGARDLVSSIRNSELLTKFLEYLATFDGRRIKEFFSELGDRLSGLTGGISDFIEKLSGLGPAADGASEEVTGALSGINDALVDVLDYLIEAAGQIDYGALFDAIIRAINTGLLAGLVLTLRSALKGDFLKGFLDNIFGKDSPLGGLRETFDEMFGTMESTLVSFQNNVKADSLRKIAIAIAILVGSLALLTLLDQSKLVSAGLTIAALTTGLFGTSGALASVNTADALKATAAIIGLSIALLIAGAAMKNLSTLDPDELERGIAGMVAGLGSLIVSVRALTGGNVTGLVKTIGIILGLVIALKLMVGTIREFGEMDPAVLSQGLLAIAASLTGLVSAMVVLTAGTSEANMLAAAAGIVTMAFALNILAGSVLKFGEMDTDVLTKGLASAGAALAGFAAFTQLLKPRGLLTASVGILIIAGAMLLMYQAVQNFSTLSWDELERGLIGLGLAMLEMVVAANAMTGALPGAAAMLVMSAAILVMAFALQALGALSWEALIISLVAIAATLLVLGVAAAALSASGAIVALAALAAVMLLMGAAAALFGIGVALAAAGLVLLAGSSAVVAGAIGVLAAAVLAILPGLGQAVAEFMTNFLTTISNNMPAIVEAAHQIIVGIIQIFYGSIPMVVEVMLEILQALLDAIISKLPDLIESGFQILLGFMQGISDHIEEVTALGLTILTEFLAGIESGADQLVDQAFRTLLAFINAVADAVEEYMPQIIEAGNRIGEAIIDGMVAAIQNGLSEITGAVNSLGEAAVDALRSVLGIHSPSTVFKKEFLWATAGAVAGIKIGTLHVVDAIKELGQKVQNGIRPLAYAINDEINKAVDLKPKISPVLNFDEFNRQKPRLAASFSSLALATSVKTDYENRGVKTTIGEKKDGCGCGTHYTQNIYSPKPLDRFTIYRDTKSLLARKKERNFE